MPDLIRLVHGNPSGLKNLVKEFRMYWKKKTSLGVDEASKTILDSSKLETSMEVDDKVTVLDTSVSKSSNDCKVETQDEFSISKRQLEIKIPSIAVREKRPEHKKICWYVHAEVLKQYNMEDIKLPNTWEYVYAKQPKWAEEKVNKGDDTNAAAKVSTANTIAKLEASIMQFAQPMTLSQIQGQAQAAVSSAKEAQVTQEAVQTPVEVITKPEGQVMTPGKAVKRSIMDMFSSAAKKSLNHVKSTADVPSTSTPQLLSDNTRNIEHKDTVCDAESKKPAIEDDSDEECTTKNANLASKDEGFSSGYAGLRAMLTSPELMRTSPKPDPVTKDNEANEEPMDVDIIVID